MMKLKIEIAFTDKNNGKNYKVGDVIEFDDARGKELLADSRKLVSLDKKVVKVEGPVEVEKEAILNDEEVAKLKPEEVIEVEVEEPKKQKSRR